ncbi:colicin uptake protein TolQ [Anatilimnocola aggregata]|uniref:Colicin uptake protein TolQ n=1 Tax=Anatilimnocola aggregata TaxID=2528021 RepID=A0A517YFX4_9BACT|nr:MotA/TolQ/ExbB proton channel family protein [Anatilimnocola aggregata]QDU29130.1 colicin uptake protein TolQ [Anatilimnocola aggregata]
MKQRSTIEINTLHSRPWVRLAIYSTFAIAILSSVQPIARSLNAQAPPDAAAGPSGEAAPTGTPNAADQPTAPAKNSLNLIDLANQGGVFMYPLYGLSMLGVLMGVERAIAIRRSRIIPQEFVDSLGQLGNSGGFDPRKAYRLCQQYPSAAARVVKAMLLKVGRPVSEIEHTVAETSQRESERLYFNVRWLNLAASVAPLLGLVGTIQGMILAFHGLTTLKAGDNQMVILANGIYTALVTTFAGLLVAIPAAMASQYFEGRLILFFHEVDELAFNLLPQVERYEGRVRFTRQGEEEAMKDETKVVPPAPAPVSAAAK